jgi:hypothetical protein
MKWVPSGIGAEPKKLVILGVLVVAIVGAYEYSSRSTGSGGGAAAANGASDRTASAAVVSSPTPLSSPSFTAPIPPHRTTVRKTDAAMAGIADFHPTLKLEEGEDVSKIDPTLRLELLAKVQKVPLEGGARNLFEFSQPPPPPPPKVIVKPGPVMAAKPVEAPKPVDAGPPPPPPPPPIPLKFYGYAGTTRDGVRRAFFLDGDDIYTASENETVKGRYKIIRIGVNSAVVEDTSNKHEQTLPLVEENNA